MKLITPFSQVLESQANTEVAMAVGKRQRFEIFKRDGFKCQYCGRTPPAVVLHCDHVIPESDGGPTEAYNLITSCADCNLGKSNIPLTSVIKPVEQMAEEAREKRAQVEAFNEFVIEQQRAEDDTIEALGLRWHQHFRSRKQYVFGAERARSIRRFLKSLPWVEIQEAIDLAADRVHASLRDDEKRWKYFCGICWNKVRAAEDGQ